jgi:NDP-sugar pyrophosphorylase family protein
MDTGNISALVLAGGKGTRIGQSLPKVLNPIVGKPMIHYSLDTIRKIPIHHILVVVGFRDLDVRGSIRNEDIDYVYQAEQLGTGHALKISIPELPLECNEVIVLNGDDSAFYDVFTLREFIENHRQSRAKLSLMTIKVKNPAGLGRISRNPDGKIQKIIEEIDALGNEKKINEINTGCYIFNVDWLKKSIGQISKSNSGEYYIPDLVSVAVNQKTPINSYLLENNKEWVSVNTQEQLKEANIEILKRLKKKKQPTVFVFSIDNTLINTDAIKKHIGQNLVPDIFGDKLIDTFWEEYENTRNIFGFVSIPDFSDAFANKVNVPEYSYSIRKMFYSLPFDRFVYDGVSELMDYIQEKGEIAIVSEGDLVYQPIKIKNLNFVKYIDEVFVFENKVANIDKIVDIYQDWRKIIIDDKASVLASFKKLDPNAITIHLQQGKYGHIPQSGFVPNLEAKNINQIRKFIQEL